MSEYLKEERLLFQELYRIYGNVAQAAEEMGRRLHVNVRWGPEVAHYGNFQPGELLPSIREWARQVDDERRQHELSRASQSNH